jgi:hypothetical protein
VVPPLAPSGKIHRHWLNRGGDRDDNCALHMVVIVRLRVNDRSRAYTARRTTEGLSSPDIIRRVEVPGLRGYGLLRPDARPLQS